MTWFNMGERFIPGETYYIPDPTLKGFKLNKNIRSLKRWNMTEKNFSYPEKKWRQEPIGGATVSWLREALKISWVITKNAHKILAPTLLLQAGDDHNVIPENHVSTCQKAKDCKIFSFQNEKFRDKNGLLPRHELLMDTDNTRNIIFKKGIQFMEKLGVPRKRK